MTLETKDGKLCVVSGASRSGKTAKVVRLVRAHKTVFVWDVEAQWCKLKGYTKVSTFSDLRKIAINGTAGKWAFVPSGNLKDDFERFCRCAYHYGTFFGECGVVAEELADVTTVAKAPPEWGILLRRGLKRNISIYPISQRWAEADKTAIGNATDFYLFRMNTEQDISYMAKKTRVSVERLSQLKPLEYIHYNALNGEIKGSKLTF